MFYDPPPWPVIIALACVGVILLIALTVIILTIPPPPIRRRKPMSFLAPYRKALIALIVGAVTTFLTSKNIDLNQTLEAGISGIITAVLVFLVPNKTPDTPA